jgi:flagellar hook-associated protein 1 FlgK
LFQSFSALAVAPNDGAARQVVLDRAGQLAVTFRRAAGGVDAAIQSADLSLRQAVGRIEALGRQLAEINTAFRSNFTARNDPALTARLFSTLDQLAELVEFTALEQPDGTVGIYLGGQSLFLLGENLYPIQLDTADVQARIFDFAGRDITTQFQGGSLGGVLELRNSTFAGYRDRLDRLAISVADTVNAQLAGGLDQAGQPPVQALFSYVGAAGAARTLTANPLATSELAAASQQAPGGNANALALAALGGQQLLDGLTLGGYYAALAASVGRGLASARESQITAENLTNQARSLRDELIRVDLNDEAALLLEFQRSYQAASKIVTTIDEMTRTVIDLLR